MLRRFQIRASLAMLVAVALPADTLRAGDWPHWRGPNRNDVTDESARWNGGPWAAGEPAWRTNVGHGASSPLVIGGRLYTMGWNSGQDSVYCLDAASGRQIWKRDYPCPQYGRRATGDEGLYSGPTSTPEFDLATGLLYTLSADGDLNCWDSAHDGKRVWGLNLYAKYDVPRRPRHRRSGLRDYGYTTAPFVHGEAVVVEVGDEEGALMAFDKRTGRRVWASECNSPAGHTGGLVPMTVEGIDCIAVMNYRGLLVARLDRGNEGRTVAEYEWTTDFANNIATPAVFGASTLITSQYNRMQFAESTSAWPALGKRGNSRWPRRSAVRSLTAIASIGFGERRIVSILPRGASDGLAALSETPVLAFSRATAS